MAKKPTDIEEKLAKILKELGLKFSREYKVGNYPVDFYIKSCKLSIQVDGNYWHSLCKDCKKIKTHKKAIFQNNRDKGCIVYHKSIQSNIIRICSCKFEKEEDIKHLIKMSILDILNGKLVLIDSNGKRY